MTFNAIVKRAAIHATVDLSLHGILDDPRRSMDHAVDLFSYLTAGIFEESMMSKIRREAENPKSCFYHIITSMVQNVDHSILKTVGTNLCFNRVATCINLEQKQIQPSPKTLGETIRSAKKMGIYFFVICGSHPLRSQEQILEICRKNKDCVFYITVESRDINDVFAQRIVKLGNIILSVRLKTQVSPKQLAEECSHSFQILKKRRCLFGYIAAIGSPAARMCCNDEFINDMAKYGCLFGWYYVPESGEQFSSCRLATNKVIHSALTFQNKPLLLLCPEMDRAVLNKFVNGGRCYLIYSNKGIKCCYKIANPHSDLNAVPNQSLYL